MLPITMASRTGQGRRSANEDSLGLGRVDAGWFAVVADGAGGHRRGAEASQRAVRTVESMLQGVARQSFAPEVLSRIVAAAHAELQRHQTPGDPSAAMHSTLVVLWIDPATQHALWAHVGDSRLYRIRHGLVDVITTDDSLVQQMVTAGLISREQARHHPHKNQLVAALGVEGEVDTHAVVRPIEVKNGDVFLLCSDGWWDCIDSGMLEATLEKSGSAEQWLGLMQQIIDERQSPRQDNFTAIAVWAGDPTMPVDGSLDDTVPRARR